MCSTENMGKKQKKIVKKHNKFEKKTEKISNKQKTIEKKKHRKKIFFNMINIQKLTCGRIHTIGLRRDNDFV